MAQHNAITSAGRRVFVDAGAEAMVDGVMGTTVPWCHCKERNILHSRTAVGMKCVFGHARWSQPIKVTFAGAGAQE